MKAIACSLAAAALAGLAAGCADPYAPTYGYSQGYSYPSYPARTYGAPAYAPTAYAYRPNDWSYYRNYNGINSAPASSGPAMTFTIYP